MHPVLRFVCATVVLSAVVQGATEEYQSPGLRAIARVYDECSKAENGFTLCLKKRALTFIDRLSRVDSLSLGDMKIVRNERAAPVEGKPLTDSELEQSLPRGLEARDEALTTMLLDRIAGVFSSRTVQISLPKLSSEELGRGLEEGMSAWEDDRLLLFCCVLCEVVQSVNGKQWYEMNKTKTSCQNFNNHIM